MRDTGEGGRGGDGDKISKSEKDQVGKHIVNYFFSVSHLLVVFLAGITNCANMPKIRQKGSCHES